MKKIIVLLILIPLTLFAAEEEIWFAKGEQAMDNKDYPAAVGFFTKVIEKNDKNALAYFNRGLSYLFWQKFENALEDFNKSIELDSTYADAYNNRGYLFYLAGDNVAARDDFDKAIELDSNFAQAYVNRAANFIDINLFEPALKDLQKALKLNPDVPSPYLELARLYYKTNKYEKAIENYNKCLEMNLVNPKIYYNRGNSYFRLGQYEKAIEDYTKTLEMNPEEYDALNNRAVAYDNLGKKELAQKDRKTLAQKTGTENLFIPYKEIVFVQASDSAGKFTFLMPKNWIKKERHTKDVDEVIISPEKLKSFDSPYAIGIKMSYNKNMGANYSISNPDSLLDFWEGSMGKNAENYHSYRVEFRKKFAQAGRYGRMNRTIVQFTPEAIPLAFYEMALAKKDILFYAFFQAPAKQMEYFEKIYDKIYESIRLTEQESRNN
jgi:tetratricopeptide (TPR) repeat protein